MATSQGNGERDVNAVMEALRAGQAGAIEDALLILNDQLRRFGRVLLRRWCGDLTLQATALVTSLTCTCMTKSRGGT